jgi:putative aminopeptidase FrvX
VIAEGEMDRRGEFLKELTQAPGPAGYERPAQEVLAKHLKSLGKITYDRLGSLLCEKKGDSDWPRVMLDGHIDEIGFMVKLITDDGFVRFTPLGGWFDQVLLSQRLVIKGSKGDVPGVIGAKPIHVLSAEEREKVVLKKDMWIDIGARDKAEAEGFGVRVGDPIVPVGEFVQMKNPKVYLTKAWDDRVGCGVMAEVLRELAKTSHPNTVVGAGSVQEEVGLRGAKTAVEVAKPDVAIALEVGTCCDLPDTKPQDRYVIFGEGPVVRAFDPSLIPNRELFDLVIRTAKRLKIKHQTMVFDMGGTDARMIHTYGRGVPTVTLSVPTRYIHSASSIIHRDDFDLTAKLVVEVVKALDQETVASFVRF